MGPQSAEPAFSRKALLYLIGLALLAGVWQAASLFMPSIIISPPLEAVQALFSMVGDPVFIFDHFLVSLERILTGVLLGSAAGFILGIIAGLFREVKYVLDPLRWLLMSIPAVVVVVVAMLWFGMGSTMVIFISSVFLTPVVYVSAVEGMEELDGDILEMAQVYRFPLLMKIRNIYLPSITAPLCSALVVVVCNGVRVAILAEVMGGNEGIGFRLAYARVNLNIPDVFSCVLLCLILVGVLEFLLLRPLQNYLLRWRK
jgi:NitT/TauT family transport system permease protein